jgi:glutamyl-tRNA reductase
MGLLALGLNHRTAPLDIREQVVFAPETIGIALRDLVSVPVIHEAAIISTCNRTEIYCTLESGDEGPALEWFLNHHHMHNIDYNNIVYRYTDSTTVRHLLRVACGLDSMVLGEPQILGQLKTAYRQAEDAGTVGRQLGRLFQHAFSVAKHVRTETAIGANPVSVAFVAVRLAQRIFSELKQQTAVLIGAGETIELVARHLHNNGIGKLIILNRTTERAASLAKQFDAEAAKLSDLNHYLTQADILVSSTASQLPIIGKGAVETALKQRKHKPMLMVDLAVPRDIEPEVGNLPDVYLYNIDDLGAMIDENRRNREEAALQAETIIENKVEEFIAWQRSLRAVETIRHYRENAQQLSLDALEKAKKMLVQGKSPEEALQYLAHTLTNKLLHNTTARLDHAAREGRHELLHAAHELLKAEEPQKK